MTVVFLTNASTSPWTRPGNWTDAGHTLNMVGCGGQGGPTLTGTGYRSGSGGGGGGHALFTYSSGALAATVDFFVGINNTTTGRTASATKWGSASSTVVTNAYYIECGAVGINAGAGGGAGIGTTTINGTPTTPVYTRTQNNSGGPGGATAAVLGSAAGGGGADQVMAEVRLLPHRHRPMGQQEEEQAVAQVEHQA